MKFGVLVFPGSNCDRDMQDALEKDLGAPVEMLWHKDSDLSHFNTEDCIVLPGGFSYGDYLRCGAISRFAPVMTKVIDAANGGMPLLGICNGFQVLCEAHLLPGALTRNKDLHFLCRDQKLVIENNSTAWTSDYREGQEIVIPLKNGEGSFQCDDQTLAMLEGEGRVIARYVGENPNGSRNLIAGITNAKGNVVGLMPHPDLLLPTANSLTKCSLYAPLVFF